jgi:uncharacterized membrane protein
MHPYAKAAIAVVVVFFALDFVWLSSMIGFYRTHIGSHLAPEPDMVAAAAFYVIYFTGIMYFAVVPALIRGTLASALFSGGLLGFLCYATYDLTNMATLANWPAIVTVVDLVWGTFVTGVASAAGFWFAMKRPAVSVTRH